MTCNTVANVLPSESIPRVSVIMIFFNSEDFIGEAIESVLQQTFRDWELLLVDDGSADASGDLARGYAEQHSQRIRYLAHAGNRNRGMGASRNLGILHARAELVAFLDSDDVWLPHKLEQQVALMQQYPDAGMLCGATLYWHGWTGRLEDIACDVVVSSGTGQELIRPPNLLVRLAPLGDGPAPSMSNLMVRRDVTLSVGGFEEQFRGLFEDAAFLAKVYLTVPTLLTDALWDQYRQHGVSCVATVWPEHRRAAKYAFLQWLNSHLESRGLIDSAAWRIVRQAIWDYNNPVAAQLLALTRRPRGQSRILVGEFLRAFLPAHLFIWMKARFGIAPPELEPQRYRTKQAIFYVNRAQTSLGLGRIDQAVADYRRALALDPGRAEWWAALAGVLIDAGEVETGVASLDRALAIRPVAGWFLQRAGAMERLGNLASAIEDYRQAVRLEPERVTTYPELAGLLERGGHAEESVTVREQGDRIKTC